LVSGFWFLVSGFLMLCNLSMTSVRTAWSSFKITPLQITQKPETKNQKPKTNPSAD